MAKDVPTSVRRFGVRYGRRTKLMFGNIEQKQRKHYKCPFCTKEDVKRISVGVWQCLKCNAKFTGKAYSL
ncbi:MAG: 50S ribosomal protein L37ae [Nanoarchaeota archaeon]|nr:50S ribosomal protein L37ae [Nanoarchaeota archaeon]